MAGGYFNFYTRVADERGERRRFVRQWWKIYKGDTRWVPPKYTALRQTLGDLSVPALARQSPAPLLLEAYPQSRPSRDDNFGSAHYSDALFEQPVAATLLLLDRRRRDGAACLAMMHVVNDAESLERLMGTVREQLWMQGCRRVIGPTGLSPHLNHGALLDHFHTTPPLHTAYNPPYLAELFESELEPIGRGRLFHIPVATALQDVRPVTSGTRIEMAPLQPERLADDLLPLFVAACEIQSHFPVPDQTEAEFILQQLSVYPLWGWLALVDGEPAGFALLQGDHADRVRRSQGGRSLLWRVWLNWRVRYPVGAGRVLHMAVAPKRRGRGIGRALWTKVLQSAATQRWRSISVGPIPEGSPAANWLTRQGAVAQQTYQLYAADL